MPVQAENLKTYYFVDCGDHDPSTLSEGNELGSLNSVTDQLYGKDAKTGYYWGVAALNEQDTKAEPGSAAFADPDDKGVYTKYQKLLSVTPTARIRPESIPGAYFTSLNWIPANMM